jgi:hypothetical protein
MLTLLFGISSGVYLLAVRSGNDLNSPEADSTIRPKSPGDKLPKLIAINLENRNRDCPRFDQMTYEACLLFQGALGTWSKIGLPQHCPNFFDAKTVYSLGSSHPKQLVPEDVLRAPSVPCFSYLYAIQVANATPVLISTANRAFQVASGMPFPEPGSDANLCIQARYGRCGNQAAVGVALFEKAGFKARAVQFYYESNGIRKSHVIPEVLIDGNWRLIDTTYGAYWINNKPASPFVLRTLEEIQTNGPHTELVTNRALQPFYAANSGPDYFKYLTSRGDILRGGKGQITLQLTGKEGVETFHHIPNYVGDNIPDGKSSGVSYRLKINPGRYEVTLNVTGSAVEGDQPPSLCVDVACSQISPSKQRYVFSVINPKRIFLQSELDIAYAVLSSIEWGSAQGKLEK